MRKTRILRILGRGSDEETAARRTRVASTFPLRALASPVASLLGAACRGAGLFLGSSSTTTRVVHTAPAGASLRWRPTAPWAAPVWDHPLHRPTFGSAPIESTLTADVTLRVRSRMLHIGVRIVTFEGESLRHLELDPSCAYQVEIESRVAPWRFRPPAMSRWRPRGGAEVVGAEGLEPRPCRSQADRRSAGPFRVRTVHIQASIAQRPSATRISTSSRSVDWPRTVSSTSFGG